MDTSNKTWQNLPFSYMYLPFVFNNWVLSSKNDMGDIKSWCVWRTVIQAVSKNTSHAVLCKHHNFARRSVTIFLLVSEKSFFRLIWVRLHCLTFTTTTRQVQVYVVTLATSFILHLSAELLLVWMTVFTEFLC